VSDVPDISVSLVNTNNRELLLGCLASLPAAAGTATLETIVVDNASTDGSADAVRDAYGDVEVVACRNRRGFAANHNDAIRRANGRHVLILNEDTVLHERSLERLCAFLDQNPAVAAVGPRILYPGGRVQASAFHFPSPARMAMTAATLQRIGWVQSGGNQIRSVDWLCGAAILARRDALIEVGGLDEQFFIYWEDIDVCTRLRDAGWKVVFFPHAVLDHHESATTAGVPERRIYQLARSRALYTRKHHGRVAEPVAQLSAAGMFAGRLAASRLLGRPPEERARFAAHIRASIRPWSRPAMEDAAQEFNLSAAV
jgi:N-acetylglucosaminyl-diphospho-decaprenol L-rhamnosyltransferase